MADTSMETLVAKKESFRWQTPTDEFAGHVASDSDSEDEENNEEVVLVVTEDAPKIDAKQAKKSRKPVSSKKFPCPTCGKEWNWPWELRRHVMSHYKEKERHETSSFKCETCGKGFQWKRDLAQHQRLHTGEKLLVCSVCDKRFTTRQALLHHVVVHTGEKPFQCAFCDSSFTQPANLRTHMKKKHPEIYASIKGNKCPYCGEEFPSIVALHQHIIEDHPKIVAAERAAQDESRRQREQSRVAEEAKKTEKRKEREVKRKAKRESITEQGRGVKGLKEWEINYEYDIGDGLVKGVDWDYTPSDLSFECEVTKRKFAFRFEYMFHQLCLEVEQTGDETKNRICPICGAKFRTPIGLKYHLLVHTEEKPFLCLHNWRSFSSHVDLKMHIKKELMFDDDPLGKVEKKVSPEKKAAIDKKSEQSSKAKEMHIFDFDNSDAMETNTSETTTATATTTTTTTTAVLATAGNGDVHMENGVGATHYALVVGEDGQAAFSNGEQQTLYVQHMSEEEQQQNMIVVIQSDDLENAATTADGSVIVVDSSQLQQVVSTDGMPVTVVHTQSDQAENSGVDGLEHALLIATDNSEPQKMVLAERSGEVEEEKQ